MTTPTTESRAVHDWHIPNIVRDVLLVVLGAMLAVGAQEWRDQRATRHRTDIALSSIRAEITSNLQRVKYAELHHRSVIDTLRALQARHTVPSEQLMFGGIFNPAHTLSTAWQTARDTRAIGELPYAVALRLGSLYEQQEQYRRIGTALDEAMTTRIQTEGIQAAFLDRWVNLIYLNQDFMGRAEGLASRYEGTLAFLDSAKAPTSPPTPLASAQPR